MDDWDLFAQIRPPTPPPAKPRRTRVVKTSAAEEEEAAAAAASTAAEEAAAVAAAAAAAAESVKSLEIDAEAPSGEPEQERAPPMDDWEDDDDDENEKSASAAKTPTANSGASLPRARPSTIMINGRLQRIVDDRPSTASLDHLPPEVLEQIFRRLDGPGVANLALACKRLYDVSFTECIWTDRIQREFGLKPDSYRGVGISARLFYHNILSRYGWSLGCWVRMVKNYGGLLKVVVENGMIVGKEVIPPENPNVEQQVTFKDVFCIKLDSKGRSKMLCLREQFNNDESAVRRRRRVYSTGQQSSSEDDVDEETKKKSTEPWDLFANINSEGVAWEEDEERKKKEEEAAAKKKKEEEEKAEELKKRGVIHGVEIEYVKEAHRRKKSTERMANNSHFHLECLCPQTHKQDFEDFRQEDNTFRFLAMTKYDTIRSYGAKFTYQKFDVKPDYVFERPPNDGLGSAAALGAGGVTPAASATAAVPMMTSGASSSVAAGAADISGADLPVDSPGFFPLKPGIFKGTYGGHGIEYVSVEKKSPFQYEAVKLSGDPNVPFGKVSFSGDLRDFLFPSEEDQLSVDKLKPMEPERQIDPAIYRTLQPYRNPADCFIRSPFPLPDKCRARFKAECQVSEWGYSAPQFIKAHLVVFTQDLLALIILDIKSVVLFHRLPAGDVGLPPSPVQIFRPLPVPEDAADEEVAAAAAVEGPPKPRRAVFRWPPPKFGEALGDVDN